MHIEDKKIKDQEYIKVKDRTVIYYIQIDSISEEQMESMMVETFPYSYYEVYN
jgi:hypothetical protein